MLVKAASAPCIVAIPVESSDTAADVLQKYANSTGLTHKITRSVSHAALIPPAPAIFKTFKSKIAIIILILALITLFRFFLCSGWFIAAIRYFRKIY